MSHTSKKITQLLRHSNTLLSSIVCLDYISQPFWIYQLLTLILSCHTDALESRWLTLFSFLLFFTFLETNWLIFNSLIKPKQIRCFPLKEAGKFFPLSIYVYFYHLDFDITSLRRLNYTKYCKGVQIHLLCLSMCILCE